MRQRPGLNPSDRPGQSNPGPHDPCQDCGATAGRNPFWIFNNILCPQCAGKLAARAVAYCRRRQLELKAPFRMETSWKEQADQDAEARRVEALTLQLPFDPHGGEDA